MAAFSPIRLLAACIGVAAGVFSAQALAESRKSFDSINPVASVDESTLYFPDSGERVYFSSQWQSKLQKTEGARALNRLLFYRLFPNGLAIDLEGVYIRQSEEDDPGTSLGISGVSKKGPGVAIIGYIRTFEGDTHFDMMKERDREMRIVIVAGAQTQVSCLASPWFSSKNGRIDKASFTQERCRLLAGKSLTRD